MTALSGVFSNTYLVLQCGANYEFGCHIIGRNFNTLQCESSRLDGEYCESNIAITPTSQPTNPTVSPSYAPTDPTLQPTSPTTAPSDPTVAPSDPTTAPTISRLR